jgi:hypothetical protein
MAAGDVFQEGPTSITDGSWLDIQPAASVEWVIHNVYVPEGTSVDFEYYDGTNIITFDSDDIDGSRFNQNWHVTNGTRVRIQNTSGATAFLAADGIVTK